MSSVPGRQRGRLQAFPAGLPLPLQTLHTHPWHNQSPLTPSNTPHPARLWTTALTQNGLKMTLFSHFLFFFTLSLDFSFLSMPDERPPRHPLHAHTIQARTHRKSMCCAERRSGGGSGGGKGEGGRSVQREKGGMKRGGEGGAREGLNASHVKLMRTNLQKPESCFPFTSSLLFCFCFLSRSLCY